MSAPGKYMRRARPYDGQSHTFDGSRGATEIRGVTLRDLKDCLVRAILLSTGGGVIDGVDTRPSYEAAARGWDESKLVATDVYGFNLGKLDPLVIAQNLCCEVEKAMQVGQTGLAMQEAAADGISGCDRDYVPTPGAKAALANSDWRFELRDSPVG